MEPQTSTSEYKADPTVREKCCLPTPKGWKPTPPSPSWEEIRPAFSGTWDSRVQLKEEGGKGPQSGPGSQSTPSGLTPHATAEAASGTGHSILLLVSSVALNTAWLGLLHGTMLPTSLPTPSLLQSKPTPQLI